MNEEYGDDEDGEPARGSDDEEAVDEVNEEYDDEDGEPVRGSDAEEAVDDFREEYGAGPEAAPPSYTGLPRDVPP